MRIVIALTLACVTWSTSVEAQDVGYRNEHETVLAVDRDYPKLVTRWPCGVFVDQVAHRLNRKDGVLRWGRKARQADGENPNCDSLTYRPSLADSTRKIIVDIVFASAKDGKDNPNARPAWQEFLGDNVGNGYWTGPKTPDRDFTDPVVEVEPVPPLPTPVQPAPPPTPLVIDGPAIMKRLDELGLQIKQHDEEPSYWVKIFGNRIVQLIMVAAGAAITEWQVNRP